MMPEDALDVLRAHDAVLMGAVGDPSVPDHVSLWGLDPRDPPAPRPVGEPPARRGCWRAIPCPLAGRGPGGRRHALRAREHRGRVRGRRRARAPRASPPRSASRRASSRARGVERVVRHAFELAAARRGVADERDEVERVALRLRALGRGRRGGGRASSRACATSGCSSTRSPRGWCATPAASTSSSRRTSSRDILTDLAAAIQGGMGMAASANIAPGSDAPGAVRAGARLGAGHRRAGHRQPGRRDLERRR